MYLTKHLLETRWYVSPFTCNVLLSSQIALCDGSSGVGGELRHGEVRKLTLDNTTSKC